MKRWTFLLIGAFVFACAVKPATKPDTPQFAFCPPAKFANCTVAKCQLQPNGNYSCWCFEDERYSAAAWAGSQSQSCVAATSTTLQSRFHPVVSYQECTDPKDQTREWAWCLGVSCTPSRNPDPNSTANLRCDCLPIPANVPPFPYVVTTATYSAENCRLGTAGLYWSSATPDDVTGITSFLQKQPGLGNLPSPVVLQPEK